VVPTKNNSNLSHISDNLSLTRDINVNTYVPGTKDVRGHPLFQGHIARWTWRIWHHRLTRAGRWALLVTILNVLWLGGVISLDTQLIPMIFVWVAFWAIALLFVIPFQPKATVQTRHPERVLAGEKVIVEVQVHHAGKSRSFFDLNVVAWGLPMRVDALEEEGVPLGTLAPHESLTALLTLSCRQRGVYTLPGYRVESDFPLHVINAYHICHAPSQLIVHPRYTPLSRIELPVGRRYQPGGITAASTVADSFEYQGNREFREGDNIRDIDWKATARLGALDRLGGKPVVREWREEYFLRVGVILDTYLTPLSKFPRKAEQQKHQLERDALERAISLGAAVSDALTARDYVVDIFADGPTLYHLTAGRSLAYREQILDLLACVEPCTEEPLANILPQLYEDLPRLTSLVCIFLRWEVTERTFVDELRRQGVGVKVILVPVESIKSSEGGKIAVSEPDMNVIDAETFRAGVQML
jgi:uncharacterized protein (DUF58 family)